MDWKTLAPAIIGGAIVAAGWIVSHYLNRSRDIAAEKRKIRITFLVEAYRRLEAAASKPAMSGSNHRGGMESALADIQLLGSNSQVGLASELAAQARTTGQMNLIPLLLDVRRTLRCELDLEQVENSLAFFRSEGVDEPD